MNIAHISPHTGGGVGAVLKDFFDLSRKYGIRNHLYCLDVCRSNFSDLHAASSKRDGMSLCDKTLSDFIKTISSFDLLLIHYWNHPLLSRFITETKLNRSKTIIWSHNSGLFEPHIIPKELVQISRKVLFTSSCSYEAPNLRTLITTQPSRFGVVHSTHALEEFVKLGLAREYETQARRILYLGTVSPSKMHPESASIFTELSRLGFHVVVAGGPDHAQFKERVDKLGGRIQVVGQTKNVLPLFAESDIFVYPLRKEHYGTGEQVILEAMAAGLPVVAFDNPAETSILKGGGGILCKTQKAIIESVRHLSSSASYYASFSRTAIQRATIDFCVTSMVEKLIFEIRSLDVPADYRLEQTIPSHRRLSDLELYSLFSFFDSETLQKKIVAYPDKAVWNVFQKIRPELRKRDIASRWVVETKGTPLHYSRTFPDSKPLKLLAKEISERVVKYQVKNHRDGT